MICDPDSTEPYVERIENMKIRWTAFGDSSETIFLLCMTEIHGCSKPAIEIIVKCQEYIIQKDEEGLLRQFVKLKAITDRLSVVFNKICTNPLLENHVNPVEWGQKYAKYGAPLSNRVPALSGMHLPIFHVCSS